MSSVKETGGGMNKTPKANGQAINKAPPRRYNLAGGPNLLTNLSETYPPQKTPAAPPTIGTQESQAPVSASG